MQSSAVEKQKHTCKESYFLKTVLYWNFSNVEINLEGC